MNSDNLQAIAREYLSRLRYMANKHGLGVLDRPQVTFTYTRVKQVTSTNDVMYDGVALSPTSDGHCVKFLEMGDMLWINGDNLAIDDINDIKE